MKQKGGQVKLVKPLSHDYTDLYTNKELIDTIKKFKKSHTLSKDERLAMFGSGEIMDTNTHQHMISLKDRLVSKIQLDYPEKFGSIDVTKTDVDIQFPPMPGTCTYTNADGKIVETVGPCPIDKLPDGYNPQTREGDSTEEKELTGGSRKTSRYMKNKNSSSSRNMARSTRRSSRKSCRKSTRKNNATMGGKRRKQRSTRRRRTSRK